MIILKSQYSVDAVDQELSSHYRRLLKPKSHECYRIAMLTACLMDAALKPKYVEGVVIYWTAAITTFDMPIPFDHAFVLMEIAGDTRIVDTADYPEFPFPVAYLVGNVLPVDELYEALLNVGSLPLSPHYAECSQNLADLRREGFEVAKVAALLDNPRRRGACPNCNGAGVKAYEDGLLCPCPACAGLGVTEGAADGKAE